MFPREFFLLNTTNVGLCALHACLGLTVFPSDANSPIHQALCSNIWMFTLPCVFYAACCDYLRRLYSKFYMPKTILTVLAIAFTAQADVTSLSQINEHDLERMQKSQHELDENIREFKKNLEGLKTTVDFAPMTV